MNDVLINSVHPLAGTRTKASSIAPLPSTSLKPGRSASIKKHHTPPRNAAIDTISRAIKGANNLVLSLRDGLSEMERENRRKQEERKQILSLRMKNVRLPPSWCNHKVSNQYSTRPIHGNSGKMLPKSLIF